MKHLNLPGLAALALSAGLLSACGGGGSSSSSSGSASDSVPTTIASSVDALIAFATGLMTDDTAEPLLLGTVTPATDDTAEPSGL